MTPQEIEAALTLPDNLNLSGRALAKRLGIAESTLRPDSNFLDSDRDGR